MDVQSVIRAKTDGLVKSRKEHFSVIPAQERASYFDMLRLISFAEMMTAPTFYEFIKIDQSEYMLI